MSIHTLDFSDTIFVQACLIGVPVVYAGGCAHYPVFLETHDTAVWKELTSLLTLDLLLSIVALLTFITYSLNLFLF